MGMKVINKILVLIIFCFQFLMPYSYLGALTKDELLDTTDDLENYLQDCSTGKLETSFIKDVLDFVFLIKGVNLDLSCLKNKYEEHLKKYPSTNLKSPKIEILNEETKNKLSITTFGRQVCVEGCSLDKDTIVFRDNTFWYFYDLLNAFGLDANFIENIEDKILIEFYVATHTKNIMFNISDNSFLYLYDGDLEFERDYYIARWSKSYFPNMGGAFWYNSKRDYENNIVELIEMKSENIYCASPDEFYEDGEIQTFMLKNNISSFCVAR